MRKDNKNQERNRLKVLHLIERTSISHLSRFSSETAWVFFVKFNAIAAVPIAFLCIWLAVAFSISYALRVLNIATCWVFCIKFDTIAIIKSTFSGIVFTPVTNSWKTWLNWNRMPTYEWVRQIQALMWPWVGKYKTLRSRNMEYPAYHLQNVSEEVQMCLQ